MNEDIYDLAHDDIGTLLHRARYEGESIFLAVDRELERRLQVASDDAFTAGYNDGYADGQDSVYPEDD